MRFNSTSCPAFVPLFCLVLVILLSASSSTVYGQSSQTHVGRCGTQDLWEARLPFLPGDIAASAAACAQLGPCDDPVIRDDNIPIPSDEMKIIRLFFHVIRNDDGSNAAATTQDIQDQVDFLNLHFAIYRIQFDFQMRFVNSTTFRNISNINQVDPFRTFIAIDPGEQLNIGITSISLSPGTSTSIGTFPWDPDALGPRGGISLSNFQMDDATLTHEMGHNLGLWHTHHGVSEVAQCGICYEEAQASVALRDVTGDLCSDTDPTPENFGCGGPGGSDPCSGFVWGATDPQNYMSQSNSPCQTEFTPQQGGRMRCWLQDVMSPVLQNAKINADEIFGAVPLSINFSGESPKIGITDWIWDFGDGDSAFVQNPNHIYGSGNLYSVSLAIVAPDGTFETISEDLIYAMAETLSVSSAIGGPSDRVRVDVSINNNVPLNSITIPFTWAGPLALTFDTVETAGLRTDGITVFSVNNDFGNKRAIRSLIPSSGQTIPPGTGPVMSLFFNLPPFQLSGDNPIALISYGLRDPSIIVPPGEYLPAIVNGSISMGCCNGTVGNVTADAGEVVDIADLTLLIDHLFINFPPLDCPAEGNVDGDPQGAVDIADLTALIDHLFINFPALPSCQ